MLVSICQGLRLLGCLKMLAHRCRSSEGFEGVVHSLTVTDQSMLLMVGPGVVSCLQWLFILCVNVVFGQSLCTACTLLAYEVNPSRAGGGGGSWETAYSFIFVGNPRRGGKVRKFFPYTYNL